MYGAMKGAGADVDDAASVGGRIVAGQGGRAGDIGKAGKASASGHAALPVSGWESAAMMPRNSARPLSRPMAG